MFVLAQAAQLAAAPSVPATPARDIARATVRIVAAAPVPTRRLFDTKTGGATDHQRSTRDAQSLIEYF